MLHCACAVMIITVLTAQTCGTLFTVQCLVCWWMVVDTAQIYILFKALGHDIRADCLL